MLTAPLGLLGYWAYSAWATHHLAGFRWVEKNAHNNFDFGKGIFLAARSAIMSTPTAFVVLTLLVIAAAVTLTGCSLAERIPLVLHAYTLVVVVLALGPGPNYLGSKPRFLLPAMLLALPLARLLARASGLGSRPADRRLRRRVHLVRPVSDDGRLGAVKPPPSAPIPGRCLDGVPLDTTM